MTPILIYYNSLRTRWTIEKMGEYSSMILWVGNAMLTQWILRAPDDLLIENIFPCFPQFAERSFHSAITGDQPSLDILCLQLPDKAGPKNFLNFPEIFPRVSGNFEKVVFENTSEQRLLKL